MFTCKEIKKSLKYVPGIKVSAGKADVLMDYYAQENKTEGYRDR